MKTKCLKIRIDNNIGKSEFIEILLKNKIIFGNVTYPCKNLLFRFSDYNFYPSDKLQFANTFVFKNNRIFSTNTDGDGFFASLYFNHKSIYQRLLKEKIILIAGTGATASSIALSSRLRGIYPLLISRNANIFNNNIEGLKNHLNINKISYNHHNYISYKEAQIVIDKEKPIIVSTLPFSVLSILSNFLKDFSENSFSIYYNKNNKKLNKIELEDEIQGFFHKAFKLNLFIFDSNYKDYIDYYKNNEFKYIKKFYLKNIICGLDQFIGQGIYSIYFFSKINLLDKQNFNKLKNILIS
ncbi:MAG: hypothetical protein ACK4YF_04550 [Exilispira sp.]